MKFKRAAVAIATSFWLNGLYTWREVCVACETQADIDELCTYVDTHDWLIYQ
jgi:hypothetical protein